MFCTRMRTLAVLLLELFPFVLFEVDFMSALYSNTFWNILMVLGRNVEQDKTTCHIQE